MSEIRETITWHGIEIECHCFYEPYEPPGECYPGVEETCIVERVMMPDGEDAIMDFESDALERFGREVLQQRKDAHALRDVA